jgi:2-polyprenyl-3-methyl-5-hydroxy-6-metoxy-1,4-benzoquinol methylase
MKQWYEELFTNYAVKYENESFTQGTIGEVAFIESEIGFDKSKKILDIGCGTGRHSIELAKRGYNVTGIDFSDSQLERAKELAEKVGVNVEFIKRDARELDFSNCFDLVIMICEGAFPLMETDEMNFKILQNAADALKNGGKIIFTTLNALYPLFHNVKDFLNSNANETQTIKNQFDLLKLREYSSLEVTDDNGKTKMLNCNERYYMPSEINWYLKTLSFNQIDIFGCKLGEFSRKDKLTPEDFEMLVVAQK